MEIVYELFNVLDSETSDFVEKTKIYNILNKYCPKTTTYNIDNVSLSYDDCINNIIDNNIIDNNIIDNNINNNINNNTYNDIYNNINNNATSYNVNEHNNTNNVITYAAPTNDNNAINNIDMNNIFMNNITMNNMITYESTLCTNTTNDIIFDIILQPTSNLLCQDQSYTIGILLHNKIITKINKKMYTVDDCGKYSEVYIKLYVHDKNNIKINNFFAKKPIYKMICQNELSIHTHVDKNAQVGEFQIIVAFVDINKNIIAQKKSRMSKLYKNNVVNFRNSLYITHDTKLQDVEKRQHILEIFAEHGMTTIGDVIDKKLCNCDVLNDPTYLSIKRVAFEKNINMQEIRKIINFSRKVLRLHMQ